MTETSLSQAIDASNDASRYDANVKFLLADKQILARILKYAVSEFAGMRIGDIMECIEGDIEVSERLLDPGLSNTSRISGSGTEDNVPGEGRIFYDIRFTAYHKKAEMKFLVNIEAQKSSNAGKLGYHLENRIIFYMARMISAQKNTEFFHSDYDSLKRVRSIWICMDNDADSDSIYEIGLDSRAVFGRKSISYNTDLMKSVIINIRNGENLKASHNILISLLEQLLSRRNAEEKKRILTEEYDMIMTIDLEGRINSMCNLSECIIEEGIEKGLRQGIQLMIESSQEFGIAKDAVCAKLIEKYKIDAEQARLYIESYWNDETSQNY